MRATAATDIRSISIRQAREEAIFMVHSIPHRRGITHAAD
jgi:hypothetical protein